MSAGSYDETEIRQGDQVYWVDYGNGFVHAIAAGRMVITWERGGSMWHHTAFARHLKLVARAPNRPAG